MNPSAIQSWVKSLIEAHPQLATVPVLIDDGTYQSPGLQQKLNEKGLCIVLYEPLCFKLEQVADSGLASVQLYVPAVVSEIAKINRATAPAGNGTGVIAIDAVFHVLDACSGKKPSPQSPFRLLPLDPPFERVSIDGATRYVTNMVFVQPIRPT